MRGCSSGFGRLAACGAVVVGLAAAQVSLAGRAEAVPGLQRTTRTSVADSSTFKTVVAMCPVGKRVLGGGGTITGGGGQVVLQQLQPVQTATDDRFVVGAREDGTGFAGNWRLTAYAVCANPLPSYSILPSASGSPSSNSPQNTLSFCLGQPLVGFGGRVTGGAGQVRLTSLASGATDTFDFATIAAREDADGFGGAWIANAYAVCASVPANLATEFAASPANSVNKAATVTCPAGTRVHGAGGQLMPARSEPVPARAGPVEASLIVDSIAIDAQLRRVTVRGVEDEAGTAASWSVRAVALCGP